MYFTPSHTHANSELLQGMSLHPAGPLAQTWRVPPSHPHLSPGGRVSDSSQPAGVSPKASEPNLRSQAAWLPGQTGKPASAWCGAKPSSLFPETSPLSAQLLGGTLLSPSPTAPRSSPVRTQGQRVHSVYGQAALSGPAARGQKGTEQRGRERAGGDI